MPKYEQTIDVSGTDKAAILSACYSSFINLSWGVLSASDDKLLALTPKGWKANSQRFVVAATDNTLSISSEMIRGEMMDLSGRNKKNAAAFLIAFEAARTSITPTENENNQQAMHALREDTARQMVEQEQQAAEVDKAMNLSGSNLYATYTIIAINTIVFIAMIFDGAGIMEPNGLVHIKWGSDFAPLTLSGDWWRLITNMFIHFGIIHLAMNMYCLYVIGSYLEPMLGKPRFIAAYLSTGILASITSLWWHTEPVNSAGASGAVFGMYGLFLAFLTTSLIPTAVRKGLLQSIGIFIVYNLAFGMKSGVDNAAHVGGLISGFAIGYLFVISIKKEKQQLKAPWVVPATILLAAIIAFFYLQQHKAPADQRNAVLNELKDANYKDNEKFGHDYSQFLELQNSAAAVFNDSSLTDKMKVEKLNNISLPKWDKAAELVQKMQSYNVSEQKKKMTGLMLQYIELKKQEVLVFTDVVANKAPISRLDDTRNEIHKILEKMGN